MVLSWHPREVASVAPALMVVPQLQLTRQLLALSAGTVAALFLPLSCISGPHDKRLSVEPAQSLGGIGASRLRDDFGDSFTYHHLARQSPGHRGCLCAFFVTENREQTIFPTTYLLASKAPEVSTEPQGAPWGSLIIGGCTPGRPEDYSGEAQARSGQ